MDDDTIYQVITNAARADWPAIFYPLSPMTCGVDADIPVDDLCTGTVKDGCARGPRRDAGGVAVTYLRHDGQ